MELDVAKLVAFALWAESGPGVAGKSPTDLQLTKSHFDEAECEEDLYRLLGEDLAFKLINYDTVWEAAEEPEAPAPEKEKREPIAVLEPAGERGNRPPIEEQFPPAEAPETPEREQVAEGIDPLTGLPFDTAGFRQEVQERKKQRGKRK